MSTGESSRLQEALDFGRSRARRLIPDRHTAEDVAQEAMVRLLEQDSPPANIEAWLTRVIGNLANDHRRRENRWQAQPGVVDDGGLPPDGDLLDRGRANWVSEPALNALKELQEIMESLGERECQVLTLHLEGWTNGEIAHRLGYAGEASVRSTVSRIKARIRSDSRFVTGGGPV